MNEQDKPKQRPSHRVSFARLNGRDADGKDILGPAREIGSIWPRKGKEGLSILRFDHMPEELRGRNGGVLFVKTLDHTEGELRHGSDTEKDFGHEF